MPIIPVTRIGDAQSVVNSAGTSKVLAVHDVGYHAEALGVHAPPLRVASAPATTNPVLVKNAAGRLYYLEGFNNAAAKRYVKFYDKATVPVPGTDIPYVVMELEPSARFALTLPAGGLWFPTGIGMGWTVGAADNDATALTAGDITSFFALFA